MEHGVGPRWCVLSVPKSGTFLALRLIALLGGWTVRTPLRDLVAAGGRTGPGPDLVALSLDGAGWYPRTVVRQHLARFQPLDVDALHAPCHPALVEELAVADIVPVLVQRDPRDVAVSLAHWWTHRLQPPAVRAAAGALPLDDRVLLAARGGPLGDTHVLPLAEQVTALAPWAEASGAVVLRYEALLEPGEAGVGAVARAAQDLGRPVDRVRATKLHRILPADSPTLRRGVPGAWRDGLAPATATRLGDALAPLVGQLGYEP